MFLQRWFIVVLCLAWMCPAAWGAAPPHLWSQSFGDSMPQNGDVVLADETGNVIVTGDFAGTVDFGGGPLTSAGGAMGTADLYVVKFDPSGSHMWSQRFGDDQVQELFAAALDNSGNIVIVGSFRGTLDFGGGVLTTAGGRDIYVAKLDPDGVHLWSKRFGDSSDFQEARGVAIDEAGNVIVSGEFQGTVDFGGAPLTSAGNRDIFLAKFDAAGTHLWSERFGDSSTEYGWSVAVGTTGDITVAGFFEGTVDFGGGLLTSAGLMDICVANFDAAGNHQWSRRFGDSAGQWARSVTVDNSGNIVLSGEIEGTVDFGGVLLASAGLRDIFIAKFDATRTHSWSQRFGDSSSQLNTSVAADEVGDIFVTGFYSGTVDFGGVPLVSAGDYDIYIVRFDASGIHIWSQRFGDSDRQIGESITVDPVGNVLLTGYFAGTVDFGGGPHTSGFFPTIFVAVFAQCDPSLISIVDVGNDQGRNVRINFLRSGCDVAGSPTPIVQYEAFRRIDPLPVSIHMEFAGENQRFNMISDQSILLQGWEYVGAIPAHGELEYNMLAATLADSSIANGMHWSAFFIRAATGDPLVFFDSSPDSGYSVDNLVPGPPSGFSVAYNAPTGVELTWLPSGDEDFDFFRIYRDTDPGFEPGPGNLEFETSKTEWVDGDPGAWEYTYKISTVDFSGNESDYSIPSTVTGVGTAVAPSKIVLEQNIPNPFNPATTISFGIPHRDHVTLRIYDAKGILVRTLIDRAMDSGFESVVWDGTDTRGIRVSSGVYFYRLSWASEVVTKKMLLLK